MMIDIIEGQEKFILIRRVNKETGLAFDVLNSVVYRQRFSFYKAAFFYRIINQSNEELDIVSMIANDKKLFILDGKNEPLYKANKAFGIYLTLKTVHDYVVFFFANVAGRHGRFLPVSRVEEVPLEKGKKISAALKKIFIENSQKKVKKTEEEFLLVCLLLFKDSLFSSNIHVKKNGDVLLSQEEMLIDEIIDNYSSWFSAVPKNLSKLKNTKKETAKKTVPAIEKAVSWKKISKDSSADIASGTEETIKWNDIV